MNSQKIENLLNLALDATQEEREKSLDLDTGYNETEKRWEVIVKYSGELELLIQEDVSIVPLLGGYAIMTVTEDILEILAEATQVEYIEKPKRLYFQRDNGKRVSGITQVQNPPLDLQGKGVLVAIIDSGIDYMNSEFRNSNGSTRILNLWDQTKVGAPPRGYALGTEYTKEELDEAIVSGGKLIASRDSSGHGTQVAGIAVGNNGVAPSSEIIVVKLGVPQNEGFPRTTEVMQGLDYVVRKALEYQKPIAINLSFGNTYGAHNGSSLLERFVDVIANYWKTSICVGVGNEGVVAGHTSGVLKVEQDTEVEIAVANREVSINLQLWKYYEDEINVSIQSPTGELIDAIREAVGTQRYKISDTELLIYYGEPTPYSIMQEIYIEFLPRDTYIRAGVWKVILTPKRLVTGQYEIWLPSFSALNSGTNFLRPTVNKTLTIPSTASRVISVGAYDSLRFTYADFSGRGECDSPQLVKPDIVAPGVAVQTTNVGGGIVEVTGTSFATPFVTGSAALLMEWGIVKGNDKFLYGEKLKAYLRRGAETLIGESEYPNIKVGYGKLDLFNTFENIRRL